MRAWLLRQSAGRFRSRNGQQGFVTAETAVAMPALVLALVASLWGVSAGAAHVRCIDAAREGARVIARGEDPSAAVIAAARVAPDGARVRVAGGGELVRVSVTSVVQPFGGLAGRLPGLRVAATATAAREDRVGVAP